MSRITLVGIVAVFGFLVAGCANDEPPVDGERATDASQTPIAPKGDVKEAGTLLGFDSSKIPPPDPEKGKPIARAFYEYLYPAHEDQPRGRRKDSSDRVLMFVWKSLSRRYMEQHRITAGADEIEGYIDALGLDINPEETKELSRNEKDELKKLNQQTASDAVKRWKMDRELYNEYGGVVVFQQLNPIEPIGAYRRFLEKMEQAGVFAITDASDRELFWQNFTPGKSFVVPAKDVDFRKPWWLQLKDGETR